MKQTPKPKKVRAPKAEELSADSTKLLPKPETKEVEIQVIETDFRTEQEASNIFTELSDNISSELSQLDTELEKIGHRDDGLNTFNEKFSSMKSRIQELTSMVKIYSLPLTDRKIVMDQLEDKVKERQALVDQSLQQLQKTTGELQTAHKQQVVDNWEKLFCAAEAHNTHGRRWKFLMQPLKTSIKDGTFNFNPEVVLERAHSAKGEDIDSILERVSKQTKQSQSGLSGVTTSEATSSEPSAAQLVEEGGEDATTPTPEMLYRDVTVWTHEPEYTRSLVIAVKQPTDIENVILNISIQDDYYTIEFPSQPLSDPLQSEYCMFSIPEPNGEWLQMEQSQRTDSLTRFKNEDQTVGTLSLNIAIHPESLENEMNYMLHLPLQNLLATKKSSETQPQQSYNIVSTTTDITLDEIRELIGDESLPSETATHTLNPHAAEVRRLLYDNWRDFALKPLDHDKTVCIPLSYCWVNVRRDFLKEATTCTTCIEDVVSEMGYVSILEAESVKKEEIRILEDMYQQEIESLKNNAEKEAAMNEEQTEDLDILKTSNSKFQNELLQLASQLKQQQETYETKLEELLDNLNSARAQTASQPVEKHTQGLDKSTSPLISTSDLVVSTSRKKSIIVTYPNPNWEEMVRGNFLERLEVFSEYMIKKQTYLRDKIRTQVSRCIEMQLATQHRLAPINKFKSYYDINDDISLPSIFMPTQCTKHTVYTPRARSYFHPFGSKSTRISQPPTIFKLPHAHIPSMRSVDLYALSENHSSRIGEWQIQEDKEDYNGVLTYKAETPAPPPSTSMSFRPSTASSVA